ncbi:unnamed protein product [Cylindrotheca closterium]|uniref:Fibronectin type-III domain-containing protein n=1 Tax=Cylindrotheca closterium TaxID=2856 RepID=A0AAD2FZE0_9STRA|nr:unnamed protein product [Cylindrotheca closterium]
MKFSALLLVVAGVVETSNAFVPFAPRAVVTGPLAMNKPFFADSEDTEQVAEAPAEAPAAAEAPAPTAGESSFEDEVEELAQEEIRKLKKASKFKTAGGVEYAPWMNMSADEEDEIRKVMKSKAEARRKRQLEEASASGALIMDSQAQELSGGGLQTKVINGDVELEWTTSSEAATKGFIIKRRAARTEEFEVLASWEDWGPLASKGPQGGSYRYLDSTTTPGGWVYRVTECENSGATNDICQALVDVQTEEEQRGAVIAAVGISVFAIAAVAAGILLDPVGGY